MSTHLKRAIVTAAVLVAVAYSTAVASPAVQSLIAHHPAVAGYVTAAVAVISAVWQAYRDRGGTQAPNTTGSPAMKG